MQFSLLALKPYRHLITCRLSAVLADQMLIVALGWQMYDLTHSALNLGLIGMAQFLPQLALTLHTGVVADRYDRRKIVAASLLLQALTVLGIAYLSLTHQLAPLALYGAAFLIGVADAFLSPCLSALVANLVGEAQLPQALAMNSMILRSAVIGGPALGGLIYSVSPNAVYLLAGACWLLAAVAIVTAPLVRKVAGRPPVTRDFLLAGIRYIRAHPVILGAISLDLFAVLLGGATALLPIYARTILHIGPMGLGVLRTAPEIGALAMSVYLTRYPLQHKAGRAMLWAFGVFGLATIVFGLSRNFALSLTALVVLGAADMISMVVRSSLVQLETPDALRGRVSAVNSLFIGTSNLLGEFESGVVATLVGAMPAVVLGGIGTLCVVGLWVRWFPDLVNAATGHNQRPARASI